MDKKENDKKIKSKERLSDIFNFKVPIRVSATDNEDIYIEYMLNSSQNINKLAKLDSYDKLSMNYDPNELVAQRYYPEVGTNRFASPDKKAKMSNEMLKINLAKAYYSNPEEYTKAILTEMFKTLNLMSFYQNR